MSPLLLVITYDAYARHTIFGATNKAKEQYEALNARLRRQVDKGLERIRQNPQLGKPLRGELKGIWSERVATFRILYKIHNKEVEVVILVIEHRKSVYGGH